MHPFKKILIYLLLTIITILTIILGGLVFSALFSVPFFIGVLIFIAVILICEFIIVKIEISIYEKKDKE
jgi:4-hydroxybenzoate polyprenyltransferase